MAHHECVTVRPEVQQEHSLPDDVRACVASNETCLFVVYTGYILLLVSQKIENGTAKVQ